MYRTALLTRILIAICAILALSGCVTPATNADELRSIVDAELSPGDSAEEIEAFFSRHSFGFLWDRHNGWYTTLIEVERNHSIRITVIVDVDRRFMNAEVKDVYTSL